MIRLITFLVVMFSVKFTMSQEENIDRTREIKLEVRAVGIRGPAFNNTSVHEMRSSPDKLVMNFQMVGRDKYLFDLFDSLFLAIPYGEKEILNLGDDGLDGNILIDFYYHDTIEGINKFSIFLRENGDYTVNDGKLKFARKYEMMRLLKRHFPILRDTLIFEEFKEIDLEARMD